MNNKVTGLVEAVGTQFNGSVMVEGKWYNFKKGVANPTQKGDSVTLTLGEWEFKGKKGVNIVAIEFQLPHEVAAQTLIEAKANGAKDVTAKQASGARDFDAENRGKVRHGLMVSLLPLVATDSITLKRAKEVVNEVLEFVMKG